MHSITDVKVLLEKGDEMRKMKKWDEAIEWYDKAIERDGKNKLCWRKKAIVLGELGKVEESLKCYEKILNLDKNDVFIWLYKGLSLYRLNKKNEALECFDKCTSIDKNNFRAWFLKAIVLNDIGRKEEALECIDKFIRIGGKEKIGGIKRKANLLFQMKKWMEAVQAIDEAQEILENEWEQEKRVKALKNLEKEMEEKKEESLHLFVMSRKVFLVMRRVDIPPEMKWNIVMQDDEVEDEGEVVKKKGKLSWEEKKKVIEFASNKENLRSSLDELWNHLSFSKRLDFIVKNKKK